MEGLRMAVEVLVGSTYVVIAPHPEKFNSTEKSLDIEGGGGGGGGGE